MKIAFAASKADPAQEALKRLVDQYGNVPMDQAQVIVALGGDGFMLQTLHKSKKYGLPVFGMKQGTVGFLMNLFHDKELLTRIEQAQPVELKPLEMQVTTESGGTADSLAINEVSLLRQTKQAAKIKVWVNDKLRVDELVCDGVLVATPVGSTAYNLSAHGPVLPLNSDALALTPISPFRPRRWRGAIIRRDAKVRFEINDHYKRPVSATADSTEVRDVIEVLVQESQTQRYRVLFDPEHNLEERMLSEQFAI
jgi:NAD+ kinase